MKQIIEEAVTQNIEERGLLDFTSTAFFSMHVGFYWLQSRIVFLEMLN